MKLTDDMINLAKKDGKKCTIYNDDYVLLYKSMTVTDDKLDVYINKLNELYLLDSGGPFQNLLHCERQPFLYIQQVYPLLWYSLYSVERSAHPAGNSAYGISISAKPAGAGHCVSIAFRIAENTEGTAGCFQCIH